MSGLQYPGHSLFYPMSRLQSIIVLFVACICSYAHADDNINRRIYAVYTALSETGDFSESDYNFLKQISEATLINCPDSTIYQYHYLIGSWLDFSDGDIDERTYHISQALRLIETKKDVLEYGIFDIEYLWLSKALARYFEEKKDYHKAISQYERTLVRGEMVLGNGSNKNLRGAKSDCLCALGRLYLKAGYEREGIKCLEDAFVLSNVDYEPGATETYFPQFVLATHYLIDKKDYRKSIEEWNKLIMFFASKNATNTKENAHMYYFLGNAYSKNKEYQQAVSTYLKGISLYKEIGETSDDVEKLYGNLLCTYAVCGDIEGLKSSLDEYQQLLSSQNKQADFYKQMYSILSLLPSEKQKDIRDRIMQGFSQLNPTQQVNLLMDVAYEKIIECPEQAITAAQQAIDILSANGYVNQAAGWMFQLTTAKSLALQNQRDFEQAVCEAQKSLEYLNKCANASDKNKEEVISRIANLYSEVANYGKVIETTERLIPLTINLHGEKSREYISSKTLLGIASMYIGETKKAIDIFKDLSSIILSMEGKQSRQYAICLHNLGRAYMLQGNKDKAIELLIESKNLQMAVSYAIDPKTNQYLNELGIYE